MSCIGQWHQEPTQLSWLCCLSCVSILCDTGFISLQWMLYEYPCARNETVHQHAPLFTYFLSCAPDASPLCSLPVSGHVLPPKTCLPCFPSPDEAMFWFHLVGIVAMSTNIPLLCYQSGCLPQCFVVNFVKGAVQ